MKTLKYIMLGMLKCGIECMCFLMIGIRKVRRIHVYMFSVDPKVLRVEKIVAFLQVRKR